MMPIWAYIGGGALLMGAIGGWTVRDWKADAAAKAAVEATAKLKDEMQEKMDLQATAYEVWRQGLEPQKIETRNTVREIYRDRKIPAQCAVPAGAISLLEAVRATANSAASGEPSPTMREGPTNTEPVNRP